MKVNQKIVREVLKKEFGLVKADVKLQRGSFHTRAYGIKQGRLEMQAYYDDMDARSFLDVYLDSEFLKRYEFIKREGEFILTFDYEL
jgi:hypothetical protein